MKGIASVLLLCTVCVLLAVMCLPAVAADPAPAAKAPAEVHGYVQNRIYASEGTNTRYRLERASLSYLAPIGSDATGYAEVYYHPWIPSSTGAEQFRVYLESAYVDFPIGIGRLRAGKGRQISFGMVPSYPNRKTSNYGLVDEIFTQDRISGLQYYISKPSLDAAFGLYTSLNIGTRANGGVSGLDPRAIPGRTSNTVFHLADRDVPSEGASNDRMTASTRIGGKWDQQKLIAGISGSYGKLVPEDIAFVNANTGLALTDRNHPRWGLDATWKPIVPWVFQGEYYGASIDDLDYNGWNLLVGYEPQGKMRYYARYGAYNIDTTPIPVGTTTGSAPFGDVTWDQQQLSLAVVYPIRKSIWLQLEGELNWESTPPGVPDVDNNVLFLELFTGW